MRFTSVALLSFFFSVIITLFHTSVDCKATENHSAHHHHHKHGKHGRHHHKGIHGNKDAAKSRRAKKGTKLSLAALTPVRPIDERKATHPMSELAKSAKLTSVTQAAPKSVSGQKTIAAVLGKFVPVSTPKLGQGNPTIDPGVIMAGGQLKTGGSSTSSNGPTCRKMDQRKPWSKATREERDAWMKAVRCTYDRPGSFRHADIVSKSLAEDFALVHNFLKVVYHGSPAFFPCHRGFLLSWLERLRSECNYQGDSLYLDVNTYTDDWNMYENQDLWGYDNLGSDATPVVGKWVDGITLDYMGSWSNTTTNVKYWPHSLNRGKDEMDDDGEPYQGHLQSNIIKEALQLPDYESFRENMEVKIHNAFHAMLRRDMYPSTSPNDAFLFFPFHSWVDCLWLKWQEKSEKNKLAYSGLQRGSSKPVSINQQCATLGLSVDWVIADLLDVSEPPGCFSCPHIDL